MGLGPPCSSYPNSTIEDWIQNVIAIEITDFVKQNSTNPTHYKGAKPLAISSINSKEGKKETLKTKFHQ